MAAKQQAANNSSWPGEPIPEILAEQRLGREVPGMRGLYAHASERMRDDLKHALQVRWEESLRARAAIDADSPVPLLGEFLAPFRDRGPWLGLNWEIIFSLSPGVVGCLTVSCGAGGLISGGHLRP